jgi:hypothetical protein
MERCSVMEEQVTVAEEPEERFVEPYSRIVTRRDGRQYRVPVRGYTRPPKKEEPDVEDDDSSG